jgi:hypothetical protein
VDEPAKRFVIKTTIAIVAIIVPVYMAVAAYYQVFPFFPGGGLAAGYHHTWHGQLPGTSFRLVLRLGSGGVDEPVGSISSPDLECTEVVYLQKADDPVTLRLDTSNSSVECQLASLFDSATISLTGNDSLRFSVDMLGDSESCDFSL